MLTRSTKFGVSAAVFAIVAGAFFTVGPGKDIRNLWQHGVIQSALADQSPDRKYSASREANLKAMYVALGLYQDSEGAYPMAKDWMSAISTRLRTTDMTQDEASKKEIRPNLPNPQPGQYGYAINENAAGKFKGDLKTPQTVLIYESPDLSKNAHGVPPSGTGALGITVDGSIVHL